MRIRTRYLTFHRKRVRKKYERRWETGGVNFLFSFSDLLFNQKSNDTAAKFVHDKISAIVKDPDTAEKLRPNNHPLGAKRICCGAHYYETYNRENVTLVDISEVSIEHFTSAGLRDVRGREYELDALILATGFDAMSGAISAIDIHGREGFVLKDQWSNGPRTYLGLMSYGFPNLFMITGPGSPSVLSNMIVSIEQHVEWIDACLGYLRENDYVQIQPELAAQADWVHHVQEVANKTLLPLANSWYMGSNIPNKPRLFMPYVGGVPTYGKICENMAINEYRGFSMVSRNPF
jgi:cyclohexanone monooxygenase